MQRVKKIVKMHFIEQCFDIVINQKTWMHKGMGMGGKQ
jgi:hypothetical protein